MTYQESATPDYTMGFSEDYLKALRRFTAEANAAHLLPHIRPGHRVLDFGCGPGNISVGLAKAAEPGEMHGVDMEESQINLARETARWYGQNNAIFHVGDVTNMAFEDGFFDVAHCHNVLTHVPDTAAALAEVKRVLKPGGVIACREMISASSFTEPDFGVIRKAWDMFEDLVEADDGHPQMGKQLKGHILNAGFTNIRVTAHFDTYSTPEEVAFIYGVALQWFLSPEITEAAIKYGASTRELCDAIADAYARWSEHPAAVVGVAAGAVVASKPLS